MDRANGVLGQSGWRGVAVLAGGAVLLSADWNAVGLPPEMWLALVWGAPSISLLRAVVFRRKISRRAFAG